MNWQFSVAGLVALIIILVIATGLTWIFSPRHGKEGSYILKKRWIFAVTLPMAALGIMGLGFFAGGYDDDAGPPQISSHTAAAVFGLESGVDYPMQVGHVQQGTSLDVSAGRFTATVSAESSAVVPVRYTYNDNGAEKSYFLTLKDVTVEVQEDATPSVTVYLKDGGNYGEQTLISQTPCKWTIDVVLPMCPTKSIYKPRLSDYLMREGLTPIVDKWITSAKITLTPEMGEKLLPSLNE